METKIKKFNIIQSKNINKIINKKSFELDFNKLDRLCIYLDKKLIISGDYNFYGIYQKNTKLWIWCTSIPGTLKKDINNIIELKKNNNLFKDINSEKSNFYYQLLTQDVLLINNKKMLLWINELLLYLTKNIYYFNPRDSENNIQFISLINIKEKYI